MKIVGCRVYSMASHRLEFIQNSRYIFILNAYHIFANVCVNAHVVMYEETAISGIYIISNQHSCLYHLGRSDVKNMWFSGCRDNPSNISAWPRETNGCMSKFATLFYIFIICCSCYTTIRILLISDISVVISQSHDAQYVKPPQLIQIGFY